MDKLQLLREIVQEANNYAQFYDHCVESYEEGHEDDQPYVMVRVYDTDNDAEYAMEHSSTARLAYVGEFQDRPMLSFKLTYEEEGVPTLFSANGWALFALLYV